MSPTRGADYDGMPVQYREGSAGVARIRCQASTTKGDRCRRFAEWVQVVDTEAGFDPMNSGALVCHVHRFWR